MKLLKFFILYMIFNTIFATILYTFCRGEINGADTYLDHYYYALNLTSTIGTADMTTITQKSRAIISVAIVIIFIFISHVAFNIW